VQRTWALLPVFLSLSDGRPLDLLELGPSAGLNLAWDRYAYRYRSGAWGSSELALDGDDRVPPPAALLAREVTVVRRRGIDSSPVDVTTEAGERLLRSFVWPDQESRLERLRRAIHVVRADPPELLAGDYVELLGDLLADRVAGAQLLVWETASTQYLPPERHERLRRALAGAGRDEPFAFVSTGGGPKGVNGYSLDVQRWPGGDVARAAVCDYHGEWLEWGR
jgi:hypothetical protein